MRKITKNAEPQEWLNHRRTPNATYQAIPELRRSLIEEQGYICAYCMRRIEISDGTTVEETRIEHIKSRENHDDKKLQYSNMVLCCNGEITSISKYKLLCDEDDDKDTFHCDRSKGSNDVNFDLFSDSFFTTLSYKTKSGKIESSNTGYNNEINTIIKLNNKQLQANRKSTLIGVVKYLTNKGWKKREIEQQLQNWNNKNAEGKYKPYCGMIVWYLQKKLASI